MPQLGAGGADRQVLLLFTLRKLTGLSLFQFGAVLLITNSTGMYRLGHKAILVGKCRLISLRSAFLASAGCGGGADA